MTKLIKRLWKDEEGAAAAEYVLILALAALAIMVGAGNLGTAVDGAMTTSANRITGAVPAP
jgi:pilus assembly protein Flp/PilA